MEFAKLCCGRFVRFKEHVLATGSHAQPFRLDDKFAVITGGGSGIGRAIARRFAASGAAVHILDLDANAALSVTDEVTSAGGSASFSSADVTEQGKVAAAFAQIIERRPIDILVNNAGVSHVGTLESTSEQDFDRIFRVNVKGFYNCAQAVITHMKARGGVILNMASIAGSAGLADRFAYSVSKGAVVAMTFSIARDYMAHKIRCNCISPARVHTPFVDDYLRRNYPGKEQEVFAKLAAAQPIGRMGEPEEVASLALYLCSDEASFITGVDYTFDGGFVNLRG